MFTRVYIFEYKFNHMWDFNIENSTFGIIMSWLRWVGLARVSMWLVIGGSGRKFSVFCLVLCYLVICYWNTVVLS